MTRNDSDPFDKESDFARVALKWLNYQPNTWFVKYHASGFSTLGIPDLLGHINGKFVSIELKSKEGIASSLQQTVITKINNSGGIAVCFHTIAEIKNLWNIVNE